MSRFDASLLRRALAWAGGKQGTAPAEAPLPTLPPIVAAPAPPALPAVPADQLAVQVAAELCRRFEGLRLRPYLCPSGVPTIGYGATHYEDGRRVRLTDKPITKARAEQLLLHQLRTVYLPIVLRLCPGVDSPRRLAALVDWTFNLGGGRLQASTLRRRVNEGRWEDVPAELRKWVYAAGVVMLGLQLRREEEAVLVRAK